MLQTQLVVLSQKDQTPTIRTAALIKAGLLPSKPADGTWVTLKLVNSGGIVADQDFCASRGGDTLYAKNGFNDYLFDLPGVGDPTPVGVCGIVRATVSSNRKRPAVHTSAPTPTKIPALSTLLKLIKLQGTKVAAARSLGLTIDQFRGVFNKAQAKAAAEVNSRHVNSSSKSTLTKKLTAVHSALVKVNAATPSTKKPTVKAKTKEFVNADGDVITVSTLRKTLNKANSKAEAAALLGTNPRTLGRWMDSLGI